MAAENKKPKDKDLRVFTSLDQLKRLEGYASGFSFLPKQPNKSILAGQKRSKIRGRGLDFSEIRNYVIGDDIRHIDWKITSRMQGEAFIRTYNEDRDRQTLFLVDQRQSMFFGSIEYMKSVIAAEIAAIGAWRVMKVKDRVGGIIFDNEGCHVFRPSTSKSKLMHFFQQLISSNNGLSAERQQHPHQNFLNHALLKANQLAKHDFLIILISDLHDANEETKELVTRILRKNDLIVCHVEDELEKKLSLPSDLIASDGQKQLHISKKDTELRDSFLQARETRDKKIKDAFKALKVPLIAMNTYENPLQQVKRALGSHTKRGRA